MYPMRRSERKSEGWRELWQLGNEIQEKGSGRDQGKTFKEQRRVTRRPRQWAPTPLIQEYCWLSVRKHAKRSQFLMWWKGLENCQKLPDALFLTCCARLATHVLGVTTYHGRLNKRGPSGVGCANERSRRNSVHGMGSDGELTPCGTEPAPTDPGAVTPLIDPQKGSRRYS